MRRSPQPAGDGTSTARAPAAAVRPARPSSSSSSGMQCPAAAAVVDSPTGPAAPTMPAVTPSAWALPRKGTRPHTAPDAPMPAAAVPTSATMVTPRPLLEAGLRAMHAPPARAVSRDTTHSRPRRPRRAAAASDSTPPAGKGAGTWQGPMCHAASGMLLGRRAWKGVPQPHKKQNSAEQC